MIRTSVPIQVNNLPEQDVAQTASTPRSNPRPGSEELLLRDRFGGRVVARNRGWPARTPSGEMGGEPESLTACRWGDGDRSDAKGTRRWLVASVVSAIGVAGLSHGTS